MKKIFFKTKGKAHPGQPFWYPWGMGGCIGRLLLFLVLLLLLLFLLSLFRRCGNTQTEGEVTDPIFQQDPLPHTPFDTTLTDYDNNLPDPGEFLPDSAHNVVPPFSRDSLVSDTTSRREIVGNVLNIILDSDAGNETFKKWAQEFKENYPDPAYKVVFYRPLVKLIQIQVPSERRMQVADELPRKITDIRFHVFIEEVFETSASSKPNDPVFKYADKSWYFEPIQAYEAWEVTRGDPNITVAVVDSYFDLNHDDLYSSRIVKPYSVLTGTGNVAPTPLMAIIDFGGFIHGSMVASMAIGNQNNSRGTSGIAPECRFMPVSIGNPATSMTIMQGLLYSIYQGANVVNISYGGAPPAEFLAAFQRMTPREMKEFENRNRRYGEEVWEFVANLCEERGVAVVWAAGNESVFSGFDPSKRSSKWIVASGIDHNLKMWVSVDPASGRKAGSNFGNFPEVGLQESTISAPSVDIFGAMPFNRYYSGPGTSFAAPLVTGAVALMKSIDPSLKNEEIIRILKETGKPVEGCPQIGPRLQIRAALDAVRSRRR